MRLLTTILCVCFSFQINFAQEQIGQPIEGLSDYAYWGVDVALSADGNIMAFSTLDHAEGGLGSIKVYHLEDDIWKLRQNIQATDYDQRIGFNIAMSADGERIFAGDIKQANTFGSIVGVVRVYDWDGASYVQSGESLLGHGGNDRLGQSITCSDDGNLLALYSSVASTPGIPDISIGEIEIYEYENSSWQWKSRILPTLVLSTTQKGFLAFSGDGNHLAYSSNDHLHQVYQRAGDNEWLELGTIHFGNGSNDFDPDALAMNKEGNVLVLGHYAHEGAAFGSGQVQVHELIGSQWFPKGTPINGNDELDKFGKAVDISDAGNIIAVGAIEQDEGTGYVQVYEFLNENWVLQSEIDGPYNSGSSGFAVSLSSTAQQIVIGSNGNNSMYTDGGAVITYQLYGDTTAVGEIPELAKQINLFPNPTTGLVNLTSNDLPIGKIDISNSNGLLIKKSAAQKSQIDISNLPSGIYFMEIQMGEESVVKKVVKQ